MSKTILSILTLNTNLLPFWRQPYVRLRLLVCQPEIRIADIVILQEVYTYDMLILLRRYLYDRYVSYVPGPIGPKAGLVTFSRHPLQTDRFYGFSALKGLLVSQMGGITIVNTHLMAHGDGDWSAESKLYVPHRAQIDRLGVELEDKNRTTVLAGDFNMPKTSALYKCFIENGSWYDTDANSKYPTFHKEFLERGRKPQKIDYIFTRPNMRTLAAGRVFTDRIEGVLLSDHTGLMVRVRS